MNILRKIRQKAFFLKFFSIKTKLILGLVFVLIVFFSLYRFSHAVVNCSLTPTSVFEGQPVTISATTSFAALAAWATLEKNGTVLSTVNLAGGPNNWSYQFPTVSQNLGSNNVAVFTTDGTETFVCNPSTGADWQKMTKQDTPWDRRFTHKAISFNNRLFVMGGVTDREENDIWYSDNNGATWTGPQTAAWSPRGLFGLVEFQNNLWLLGGSYFGDTTNDVPPVTTYNDIWVSSNGLNWSQNIGYENAPWLGRYQFGYAVYDGKIWIVGGYDYLTYTYKNDIWTSADGLTWTSEASPPWSARYGLQLAAWDEDGIIGPEIEKLWLIAGRSAAGRQEDVWSYDSTSGWVCVAGSEIGCLHPVPAWAVPGPGGDGRVLHQALIFDDPNDDPDTGENMYIMGGQTVVSGSEVNYNDVWVTTPADTNPGADWTLKTDPADYYAYNTAPTAWPGWSGRRDFGATVHDNKMWVLGGYEITARVTWNDVWYSDDGADWNLVGENYGGPFQKRWGGALSHLDPDGPLLPLPDKLYILGGSAGAIGRVSDVWSSLNGTDWTCESGPSGCISASPGWVARNGHEVVNYNNQLYLIGGSRNAGAFSLGYCSLSPTKKCTNGIVPASFAEVNCLADPNEGICLPDNLNDIWSFNGSIWAEEKSDAQFVGRYYPSITVFNDGSGEKMWMTGGHGWGRCFGGTEAGAVCDRTTKCTGGICSKICYGGDNKGLACTVDAECPASVCAGRLNTSLNTGYLSDVWFSSDGVTWYSGFCSAGSTNPDDPCNLNAQCLGGGTCDVNKASWPGRYIHDSVAFNDGTGEKLYVMAGWGDGAPATLKDTYSSVDGRVWTPLPAVPWLERYTQQSYNYDDKIFMLGGNTYVPSVRNLFPALWTNEVWSTADGDVWSAVTTDAAWQGRDFFGATTFKNRMWLMGGDSAATANNDVWASTYDFSNMTFTVNYLPSPSSSIGPMPPGDVEPPCQAVDLLENDILVKAINWYFHDNATDEIGFKLYEVGAGSETLKLEVATSDISQIQEKLDLQTNQPYTRTVKAYNNNGTSAGTTPATCYTLANKPNQVNISNITAESITIKLDPNDGNPPETLYAIRVISGQETNFVNPDGSFSSIESRHTYAEFGGANGIVVTGTAAVAAASVQMALTTSQNYSFSAKAKNGDGIETAYSDSSDSITQPAIVPNITATKGVAVNLVWNSNYGLFSTAWANDKFIINANEPLSRALGALAWLLNIVLLILLIMFSLSLSQTLKNLKHKIKYPDTFKLIWSILSQEAHHVYYKHAPLTEQGIFHSSSYHRHEKLHSLSRQTFKGALVAIGLKLIILGALVSGLISLNHGSLAQTAPYNQNTDPVAEGDTLSYVIEVKNEITASAQDAPISNAAVTDTIDSNLENFAVTGLSNCGDYADNSTATTLNISGIDVSVGTTCFITFTADVKAGSVGNTIINQAQVSGSNFNLLTNETSNSVVTAATVNENVNQPPVVPPPTNENINQPPIVPPPSNENINQPPVVPPSTNANMNQPPAAPPESGTTESQIPLIGSIIDSWSDILRTLAQIEPFKSLNEIILDNPQVEQAGQNVVTPILITVAAINVLPAVLFSTLYLLPFLHLIFLEPFLLLFGKKRKKWGVVYNSLTKLPIDLALVRLYNKKNNQLIQTKVTDRDGRYIIIAKEPGKYYLSVTKPGFISPTGYLKAEKQDAKYIDLYHGEAIEVTAKNAVITANIPLDPSEKKALAFSAVIRSYFIRNLRLIVSYAGIILALIVVLIIPTVITIGCLILHILLFLAFRRLIVPARPKNWGIVYDAKTKAPLGSSVVRIFDIKFNKLLETQVTDHKGRYAFLVGKNEYQLLTEKPGYQKKEVKPVDLVKNQEIVNLDVGLDKS